MGLSQLVAKTWGEFTPDDVFEMAVLRSEVFFLEQKITEEEFDRFDRDPLTRHLWFADDAGMVGYLRIVHDPGAAADHEGIPDSLGRMVVRADARGQGIAQRLMQAALDLVGDRPLYLHGQTYVSDLYARFGFEPQGGEFEEAGIPHILMIRHPSD
jgi:ElaA protein